MTAPRDPQVDTGTDPRPATDVDWWCSHGYGLRSEQWEPHRLEVEAVGTLAEAVDAILEAAYGDRDGRNIFLPLYEPNGTKRTEWERLKVARARLDSGATR